MSVNGQIPQQCFKEPTTEQQLNFIDHELRKLDIKRKSLEESRRELINRHNLNKDAA